MALALFRPTFCFFVVVVARHGIQLGTAESTEEDAWMSMTQFQATLLQYNDKASVPQSSSPQLAQGDVACQEPTDAFPARESKRSAWPPTTHAPVAGAPAVAASWVVRTTSACLQVVLKLLTCAVVIDGLVRWCRPQEGAECKSCEKSMPKTSILRDFVHGVAQRMGSPAMAVLLVTLAVSPLVFEGSELLVALVGGGLYLVVWSVANAPMKSVPTKKLTADSDDDKNDPDYAQQENEVAEDRLLAALKLEHEADVYVPLWQSTPQTWSLLFPESEEDKD